MRRANTLATIILVFMATFITGSILFYQVSKVQDYREAIAIEPFTLDLMLFYDRITNNPDCLAYEKDVVLPNSIDKEKFNSLNLDNCIFNDPTIPQYYPSVKLKILNEDDSVQHEAQTSNFVRYKLEEITILTNFVTDGSIESKYVTIIGSPGLD